jgi:hypothetical protein
MDQLQCHIRGTPQIWLNICAFPHILGSPSSYMLGNCSTLNFLIYGEILIFFFISVLFYLFSIYAIFGQDTIKKVTFKQIIFAFSVENFLFLAYT